MGFGFRGVRTVPDNQAILRLNEANRVSFDSPQPAPGAAERESGALHARLAASRAEAATLRLRIHALETSTSWKLTGPLRQVLSWLKSSPPPPPPASPVARVEAEVPTYERWVEVDEPAALSALSADRPGGQAIRPQRLGVVLLPGPDAAAALARLLEPRVEGCQILAFVTDGDLPDHVRANDNAMICPVPPGFSPAHVVLLASQNLDVDLLCFLDPRDVIASTALFQVATAAARYPEADIVFADEDWADEDGMVAARRVRPFFKPGWDAELQRSRDLLGPFTFFRLALVREAVVEAGPAWRYDLANQVARSTRPERILHIPAVLCHRRAPPPDAAAMREAAEAAMRREGTAARAVPAADMIHRMIYPLPRPAPLVSVIIPTRDHPELLGTCTDALLRRTDYDALELLIVDNGSTEAAALFLLDRLAADSRVRVLRAPGPFNWSALNNRAAHEARGEVLLLLNNDIDALEPDWLTVLASHAIQPGVGAVGPKLLYPDGRVQHAGLTTTMAGLPQHLFRFAGAADAGPFELMAAARSVWAVTGACLAIARDVFYAAGGLNEALPVAYNDVDLCMRLTALGYRIVWTPWACLEHRELASRQSDHSSGRRDAVREELDRLLRDWGRFVLHDPFFNSNLDLENEQLCFGRARIRSTLA